VLPFPNLQKNFEVEIDASGYAMGEISIQGDKLVCYYFEIFHGGVLKYSTYDNELYALVQYFKKWKNYLIGKGTIIQTDHQPLQYLQA
jgi:hypothetical protein